MLDQKQPATSGLFFLDWHNSWMSEQEHADTPRWKEAGRVHEWRRYIGERTRAIWDTFTPEQRLALMRDAQDASMNEEWE